MSAYLPVVTSRSASGTEMEAVSALITSRLKSSGSDTLSMMLLPFSLMPPPAFMSELLYPHVSHELAIITMSCSRAVVLCFGRTNVTMLSHPCMCNPIACTTLYKHAMFQSTASVCQYQPVDNTLPWQLMQRQGTSVNCNSHISKPRCSHNISREGYLEVWNAGLKDASGCVPIARHAVAWQLYYFIRPLHTNASQSTYKQACNSRHNQKA